MKIVADANIPFVAECFSSIGQVEIVGGREITASVAAEADVLLVRSITSVDENLLSGSKVRFVGTATIGFDHVDIDYLRREDIGFASAPGSNANSAAEYVIGGLLEVGQRRGIRLEGRSIGIIGVGNVGGRLAKKCTALGMKVYLNDPPLERQSGDSKYRPIEGLYGCDFITLHTPLTYEGIDKTYHLADGRFFESLKPGCVFVNASRGGVVESGALRAAIESGRLGAVVLDVWEDEPSIDTELLEMVDIGTAHIAGYSLDGKIAGMIMIYEATCEYFDLEGKFGAGDFLPEPAVPELKMDAGGSEEDIVAWAVRGVYDIREDDARLRDIANEPAEKRGAFFDGLRKNYPVRREFQNTIVYLATESTEVTEKKLEGSLKNKSIAGKLAGIGFKV